MAKEKVVKVVITNSSGSAAAAEGIAGFFKWLFVYPMLFLMVTSLLYSFFVKVRDFLFGWF